MSVLNMSFGTCLEGPVAASDDENGVIGKALRGLLAGAVFSLGAVLALAPANSAPLTFNLDTVHTDDAVAPGGAAPWVTATFDAITGGISLTLETTGLIGTEFLTKFHFNIEPFEEPGWSYDSGVVANESKIQFVEDGVNAGGSNGFDAAVLYFPADNEEKGKEQFSKNKFSVYHFSGLTLDHINHLSAKNELYVSAHIQGTGTDGEGSAWITGGPLNPIPLPPAAFLFLTGLAGMGLLARRRRARLGPAAA